MSPGSAAVDEDDEAVQARDAVPAVGERVDAELELLVLPDGGGHVASVPAAGLDEAGDRTLRVRGPSNSQKKMPWQVPRASLPSFSGTSTCGPTSGARTWDGAFGPSASTCCHAQPSSTMPLERHLEVVDELRVDLLVDDDAGRRVRDVDERGRAPPASPSASRTCGGDVDELRLALRLKLDLPHGRLSYATHGHGPGETSRRTGRRPTGSSPRSTRSTTSTSPGSRKTSSSSRSTSATPT